LILDPHPLVLIAIKNPSLACDVGRLTSGRREAAFPNLI